MSETQFQRIVTHVKGIFTTGNGYYLNEQGEQVYGKLPRTKVEHPLKTVMRPTAMSALLHPSLLLFPIGFLTKSQKKKDYVYFFVGWMAWTMDGSVPFLR